MTFQLRTSSVANIDVGDMLLSRCVCCVVSRQYCTKEVRTLWI